MILLMTNHPWLRLGPHSRLNHITSMVVRGEKSGGTRESVSQAGDRDRRPFSQEQCIYLTLLSQCESFSCTTCHERVHVMCIRFLL
jgi:hypothetical protein